jgi:hypothetical protein
MCLCPTCFCQLPLKHSNLGQSEVHQPAVAILTQQNVAWFYVSANFALTTQYRLSLLMFVVKNKNPYVINSDSHNTDTMERNNLCLLKQS